ncbi:MAG: putative toxin-antitoxin system toxin component, PIN family [Candidatus Altiarchaeota archaeon]
MKPIIVVDTNLFIAGRWNPRSSSNSIIDLVLEDKVNAVYTFEIKDENLFILEKVKPGKEYLDKVIRYYQHARKVVPARRVSLCPDKSDNRFLEAAEAAGADYIVTSDHHLLDLDVFSGARIVKPSEFMRIFEGSEGRVDSRCIDGAGGKPVRDHSRPRNPGR